MELFLVVSVCVGMVYGKLLLELSAVTQKCDRNGPNLEKCLIKLVEAYRPILAKGIPQIEFPSLEPFILDRVPFDSSIPGLTIKGYSTNITAHGASEFQITKLKIQGDKVEATIVIPKLQVTANYDTEGTKMFFVKIDSTGTFHGVLNDVTAEISMRGKLDDDDDGLEYIRVPFVSAKITIGRGSTLHVSPDNKRIASKIAANMINKLPSSLVLKLVGPVINDAAAPIIKKIFNKILNKLPLKEVLSN